MNFKNSITYLRNTTPRTRALTLWAPLCIAASYAISQNLGVVNGGTVIALAIFAASGYKAVTGLVE